jgi:hypothetical protein
VQASAGFSFSPFVVYAPAAPTAATIAGSGFNPTYGMPLVQYFSPNGTLVAQETATSVSSDGTSIQISPGSLDFSTLIPGTYAGVLSNAGPNGTWNYVGDTAVSVLTPSVSIIGSLKTDSSSGYTDYGTVSAIVNGHMETVNYGPNLSPAGATACNISTALTNAFNSDSNSSTAAVSSGGSNGTDGSDLGCGLWITNKTSSTSGLVTTPNSQSNYGYMPLLGAPSFIAVPSQSVKASGGVTIVGNIQGVPNSDGTTSYNTGSVSVTANGFTKSVTYGSDQSNSDPYGILSDLATAFNNDANSPVTASVDSTSAAAPLLNLTSKAGPSSNLVITVGADTVSGPFPTQPSFVPLPSSLTATGSQSVTIVGSLQQDAAGDQDDSVVCMVINTIVHCAGYQSNPPPSTANAFASALATAFNSDSNSPVTASASGNVVTYTSKSGTTGSFTISLTSVQYNGVYMGPPSFIPILSGH